MCVCVCVCVRETSCLCKGIKKVSKRPANCPHEENVSINIVNNVLMKIKKWVGAVYGQRTENVIYYLGIRINDNKEK